MGKVQTIIRGLVLVGLFVVGGSGFPGIASAANAPLGYQLMCLKTPAECKGGGAAKVSATKDVLAVLKSVNLKINRSIKPRYDVASTDVWNPNAKSGDCEDYALAKRKALIKAGVPAGSLRLAHVKTRSGEGHAVLIVKTSKGDLVLDNLTDTIKPLIQSGLRVVSMAGANPTKWN